MAIENSSLYREILAIINGNSKPVHFSWSAIIHVDKLNYNPLKILSIDFSQDYENNYSDEIIITLSILGGTYAKDIYPFKDKVDITLLRTPITEVAGSTQANQLRETERYTATLLDTGNPIIEGNGANTPTRESLNLTNIFEVSFQLVNKSLEQMRMMSVGGIYRSVTAIDVIKCVLTNEMKKIVVEGIRKPVGVDIIDGYNKQVREHVVIPHGTKLVNLPEYVHQKCGGIYSSGFGYYFQKAHWFIYPCYDTSRFNSASKTLTIINVPRNKFPNIERTYRADGKNTTIMATGEVKFRDDSEVQQLNLGNGVRFSSADNFMSNFSTTTDNKTSVSRGSNNTEVTASPRANGNNNVHISSDPINSNPFLEYSKLARRQGSMISLSWENSLPSLVSPGMMVKILYLDGDNIAIAYGTLLKTHHYTQMRGIGMTDTRYISNSSLHVFVKQIKK
jgi:hypothetical protein